MTRGFQTEARLWPRVVHVGCNNPDFCLISAQELEKAPLKQGDTVRLGRSRSKVLP